MYGSRFQMQVKPDVRLQPRSGWSAVIIMLLFLWLSACSSSPEKDRSPTHIGWYCEGEPGTPSWQCSQRALHQGRVAGEAVAQPQSEEPVKSKSTLKVQQMSIVSDKRQSLSWREQLPGLDGSLVDSVDEPAQPKALIESRLEPAPQPEPFFERWEEDGLLEKPGNRGKDKNTELHSPQQRKTALSSDLEANRLQSPASVSASEATLQGYTVQLAAFHREADAQRFIESSPWRDIELQLTTRIRLGRPLFVVTFGQFPTRNQALQAWRNHDPGEEQDIWVRLVE